MDDGYEKLIRDYVAGELSGQDLIAFENQLKNNTELASELELYLALKALDNHRLKKQLGKEISVNRLSPEKPKRTISHKRLWWLAAACAAFVIITAVWKSIQQPPEKDARQMALELINTPYPPPVTLMGGNDSVPEDVQQAIVSYKNGDYASASQQLVRLDSIQPLTDEMLFYAGESFMQNAQWEKAIAYFDRIPAGYWQDIAKWRCALTLIQKGDDTRAKQLLEELKGTTRKEQAVELLQLIE